MKILKTGSTGFTTKSQCDFKCKLIKIKAFVLLALLLLIFQLFGCSGSERPINDKNTTVNQKSENRNFANKPVNLNNPKDRTNYEALSTELTYNRTLWKENNISNYNFVCLIIGGGMSVWNPALMKVRNNKPISIEIDFKSESHLSRGYEDLGSVENLFGYIEQELDNGSGVTVKYNKLYGYPEEIHVLFMVAADAYQSIEIKEFEIIK